MSDLKPAGHLGADRGQGAACGLTCRPGADAIRHEAIAAALAYFQTSLDSHPLVLCTRFDAPVDDEYSDCFFVTVAGRACEVFRTLEQPYSGLYDVESADDISPTFERSSEREQIVQFVCAVALHAFGLLLQQVARVEALEMDRPSADPPTASPVRWIITFSTSVDLTSTTQRVEVWETPVGIAREYRGGSRLPPTL